MSFQNNAFQPNAFQLQAGITIDPSQQSHDSANQTIEFLDQEAEYLTTLGDSLGQAPDGTGPTSLNFPTVKSQLRYVDTANTTTHVITFPSYAAGDRIVFVGSLMRLNATMTAPGWTTGARESPTSVEGQLRYMWRDMDGTEGASVTVTVGPSSGELSGAMYVLDAGTYAGEPPVASWLAVTTTATVDPPAVTAYRGKLLYIASISDINNSSQTVTSWSLPNGRIENSIVTDPGLNAGNAHSYATSVSVTADPPAYTMSLSGESYLTLTLAILGSANDPPNPHQVWPDTDELGLELPDGEGFTQNGVRENDVPLDCVAPVVGSVQTTAFDIAATSHLVSMPSVVSAGDRLYVVFKATNATTPTTPAGWTLLDASISNSDTSVFYRNADGTEGGTTVNFVTGASQTAAAIAFNLLFQTFNAGEFGTTNSVATTLTYDPPLVTYFPGDVDQYLYVAIGSARGTVGAITNTSYPAGYTSNQTFVANAATNFCGIALSTKTGTAFTEDPGTGQLAGGSTTSARTLIIRGFCGLIPMYSDQAPDDSYGWDDADYGTQSDPQIEDLNETAGGSSVDDSEYLIDDADYGTQTDPLADDFPQDFLLGIEDGNTRDDTDYEDYSTYTDPVGADADLGQSIIDTRADVEDATYTDFTDYGTQSDPQIDDADLGQSIIEDGNNRDDTDYEPYGTQTDPLAPDLPEDFPQALIDDGNNVEDPTYADWFEYGTQSDILADILIFEDFNLGLDDGTTLEDPTFTDFTDYGTQSDPQIDDADLGQAIIEDGNTRDDTDYEPYGTQTDPLAPDLPEDFILGIDSGVTLEDPSLTDTTDYSTQSDPLADDVDLGQSVIDSGNNVEDPTGTDFTDYGTQSDPLAPDVDLAQGIIDCGDNLEDPTGADWFEYGTQTDPLPPDAAEDQILGIDDGTNLDDPTQTDATDYGTQSDILLFLQQDFNLGTGDGLDDQDWTDFRDYGFTQDGIGNMEGGTLFVTVTGVEAVFSNGCIHVVIWADISDSSAIWTVINDVPKTWTPIADVPKTWTEVPNTTATWTDIPNSPNTWTEDC